MDFWCPLSDVINIGLYWLISARAQLKVYDLGNFDDLVILVDLSIVPMGRNREARSSGEQESWWCFSSVAYCESYKLCQNAAQAPDINFLVVRLQ